LVSSVPKSAFAEHPGAPTLALERSTCKLGQIGAPQNALAPNAGNPEGIVHTLRDDIGARSEPATFFKYRARPLRLI